MAQPVYVVNDANPGLGIFGLVFVPAIVPPGYLVIKAWDTLSVQGWHPVFKILACGGVVAAVFYALLLMYRHLPVALSTFLTVAYLATVYWIAAAFFIRDPIWIATVAAIAGLVGFYAGRAIAREQRAGVLAQASG